MNTQHTPGPWIVSEWRLDRENVGENVATAARACLALLRGKMADMNADVHTPVEPGNGSANARLIAAAPDLLTACEEAKYLFLNGGNSADTLARLRDAIRKARNE